MEPLPKSRITMRLSCLALFCVFSAFAASAHADCTAQSAATRPHLVELYSSEGCSSCPPAENWLRTLHTGADVVPLEFHVDYWDGLGWRDRFASAQYTARQYEQARRDGGTAVYTPQLVLDGHNWGGRYRGGRLTPPEPAAFALRIAAQAPAASGSKWQVRVESDANTAQFGAYRNYVALVEDTLTTQVQAGENRGRELKHDHVVRALAGPLPLVSAQTEIAAPADVDPARASLVAFAQDPRDGKVGQVAVLPLTQCAKQKQVPVRPELVEGRPERVAAWYAQGRASTGSARTDAFRASLVLRRAPAYTKHHRFGITGLRGNQAWSITESVPSAASPPCMSTSTT